MSDAPARDPWADADQAADAMQRWLFNVHRIDPAASIVRAVRAASGRIELRCSILPAAERHAAQLPSIFEGYVVQYPAWDGADGPKPGNLGHRSI